MKTLVNERVNHNRYGTGVIVKEELNKIGVQFDKQSDVKEFLNPNSFEQYLTLEKEELQQEYYQKAVDLRLEKERQLQEQREAQRQKELEQQLAEKEAKTKRTVRRKTTKAVTKAMS